MFSYVIHGNMIYVEEHHTHTVTHPTSHSNIYNMWSLHTINALNSFINMYLTSLTCYILCCTLKAFEFHNSITIFGLLHNLILTLLLIHILPKPSYTPSWSISCYVGNVLVGLASRAITPHDPAAISVAVVISTIFLSTVFRINPYEFVLYFFVYGTLLTCVLWFNRHIYFHMLHGVIALCLTLCFTSDRDVDVPVHGFLTGVYIECLAWFGTEEYLLYVISLTPLKVSTLLVCWIISVSFVISYEWWHRRTHVRVETIPVKVYSQASVSSDEGSR